MLSFIELPLLNTDLSIINLLSAKVYLMFKGMRSGYFIKKQFFLMHFSVKDVETPFVKVDDTRP